MNGIQKYFWAILPHTWCTDGLEKGLEIEGLMKNFATASLAVEQPNKI